ncbi:MAG: glycine cleavage system protein GcvH [Candidatus Eisenbacteria bacterium]
MSAEYPAGLKYTKEHEWVFLEGEVATVGITHYAQSALGDIVFVELPSVGDTVEAEAVFGSVEAVKAVNDLYSPVGGEVTEINDAIDGDPAIVNSSPYEDGWMIKVKVTDPSILDDLMGAEEYQEFVAGLEEGA